MKQKITLITNVVLVLAVVGLYVMHFAGSCSVKTTNAESVAKDTDSMKVAIAYINVDTLLSNYTFAKEANEKLLARSERSQNELSKKMNQWQKEGAEFQRKIQSNSFLTRERAEQENARLMQKRQDLEKLDGKLTQELMDEQKKMNEQLKDTINNFLKIYNQTKKFQIILSNTQNDNVLYSEDGYDITNEVVEMLNARNVKVTE